MTSTKSWLRLEKILIAQILLLDRAYAGAEGTILAIENAEIRLVTLRADFGNQRSRLLVLLKRDAIAASEAVEAMHREYRRSLA